MSWTFTAEPPILRRMNYQCFRLLALMGMLGSFLVSGGNLFAQPAGPGPLLRQAYMTLSMADHDYKGHRVAAMKQIEAAGRLLKLDLRGDRRGRERQAVSDDQLRAARGLLEQARAGLAAKPLKHVNNAIKQINIALNIR